MWEELAATTVLNGDWLQGRTKRRPPATGYPFRVQPVAPEDFILRKGDVVFLESRAYDVFHIGGLLTAGAIALPRDTDFDMLRAVTTVKGLLFSGTFPGSTLSSDLLKQGLGNPLLSLKKTSSEVSISPRQIVSGIR
ncbi:MAG: hypothetical protein ACFCD0_27785 [Gemmataceae bacterium]